MLTQAASDLCKIENRAYIIKDHFCFNFVESEYTVCRVKTCCSKKNKQHFFFSAVCLTFNFAETVQSA